MKKKLLLFIVVLCSYTPDLRGGIIKDFPELSFNDSFSIQDIQYQNEIEWSANRKLVWEDFKGEQDTLNFPNSYAVTNSSIIIKSNPLNSRLIVVRAVFDNTKSWVLSEGKTGYLLKHEQLHFDVTELYARKVRKALITMNMKHLNHKEMQEQLLKIKAEYENYQKEYDEKTQHSKDKVAQKNWEAKVKLELINHELFKSN